ncbi:class I SAM-dependent DNA methyltransferase [Chloroflexota bacterium]
MGSAYEVLGQLSGKDTKAGQFFTPENIVRFMVMLADLKSDDVVLDFACGTARFLIYAMYDMIAKVSGGNTAIKEKHIKEKQLYGTDYDPYVAKLSKMNMYIHGDGKTNIQDKNGLLLYTMDGQIDAILTNPPLGDLDYRLETYDEDFLLKRMSVIPKKNVTQGKIDTLELKQK